MSTEDNGVDPSCVVEGGYEDYDREFAEEGGSACAFWSGNRSGDPDWLTDGVALVSVAGIDLAAPAELVDRFRRMNHLRWPVNGKVLIETWETVLLLEQVVVSNEVEWDGGTRVRVGHAYFAQERLSALRVLTRPTELRRARLRISGPDVAGEGVVGMRDGRPLFILLAIVGQEPTS